MGGWQQGPTMFHTAIAANQLAHLEEAPLELAVIIPTYNEAANVEKLLCLLDDALKGIVWEAIFVDDNSVDGTAKLIRKIGRNNIRVRVLQRLGRRGLSSAVIEGMLATSAPVLAVIDADLQHDEALLPRLYAAVQGGADLAVGSRYVGAGGVGEWDARRQRSAAERRCSQNTSSRPILRIR
jgi:dolichol-phosphate mannosyltransferase